MTFETINPVTDGFCIGAIRGSMMMDRGKVSALEDFCMHRPHSAHETQVRSALD